MWTLLRSAADWLAHCNAVAAKNGFSDSMSVRWSPAPLSFPCLAVSIVVAPAGAAELDVMTAVVYPEDARQLMGAVAVENVFDAGSGARWTQADFNREFGAALLAAYHFLLENDLCTPEGFDKAKALFAAKVDQWWKEDVDDGRPLMPPARKAKDWPRGEA